MTKTKSTKRSLLMSALVLIVCVTMLVGTTFAWFTDSVTSGRNKIVAGNLDVVLEYKNDVNGTWAPVDENTKIFNEDALYEPGYTEVVFLRVSNAGTLALKYNLLVEILSEKTSTNVNGGELKLSDYLQIGTYLMDEYSSGANYADLLLPTMFGTREAARSTVTLNKLSSVDSVVASDRPISAGDQSAQVMAIVLTMPETVGNEANYDTDYDAPEIELGINLVATQFTEEEDSFDNQYDKDAKYPVKVKNADELKNAFENGDNVVLTDDIVLNSTLMTKNDAVIDLNGNTITAPSNGNMFHSSSDTDPSITITSSTAGAEINVSGGDVSVLLGYGSTVIENVTINATGRNNKSPNPFNVYGDLTLGEGTVVNIDYLGTALISNNGKVAINIDGAEINVGEFKTNGTSIMTLNQASTLKMKNTSLKIDNFVLSPFGGDSLVSKVDGVTIDGCNFDVTDSNGASCTFVAKDGKYRLVQK